MTMADGSRAGLCEHAEKSIGCLYVSGGQGEKMTPELIRRLEKDDKDYQRALDQFELHVAEHLTLIAYDCSGLVVKYLLDKGLIPGDLTANGIYYTICEQIGKAELQAGDLVFKKYLTSNRIYHVGIYMGDGTVVHAKGRDYGVVREAISKTSWNRFGRLNVFKQEDDAIMIKAGQKDGDTPGPVYMFQHACLKAGRTVLQAGKTWADLVTGEINGCDGSQGKWMQGIVTAIQAKYGLPQTGDVDALTYGYLVSEIDVDAADETIRQLRADLTSAREDIKDIADYAEAKAALTAE